MISMVLVMVLTVLGAKYYMKLSASLYCENTMEATSRIFTSHLLDPTYQLLSWAAIGEH